MLNKKLLIIGNGFDCELGAPTSYKAYFNSNDYLKIATHLNAWYKMVENSFQHESPIFSAIIEKEDRYGFTLWDLLFYLKALDENGNKVEEYKWCNIEEFMDVFLVKMTKIGSVNKTEAQHIFEKVNKYFYGTDDEKNFAKKSIIKTNHIIVKHLSLFCIQNNLKDYFEDQERYYNRLIEDLLQFEKNFGKYIQSVTADMNYKLRAQKLAFNLLDGGDHINIDSFNYSDFSLTNSDLSNVNYHDTSKLNHCEIRHINGNCASPIFGIDIPEKEFKGVENVKYFTKTSRRLYQDVFGKSDINNNRNTVFEEVVVYGHSLNLQDYDYFYYIFTILEFYTMDVTKMGKITFMYRIYDEKKATDIRNDFIKSVHRLLEEYEKNISSSMMQKVLINLLRFSGKLIIEEYIP